jgi:hypothetical protein
MHDPSTVAHEIKNPFSWLRAKLSKGDRQGSRDTLGGYRYVAPLITIWHEDPMEWGDNVRGRGDDSCGWFRPPYTKAKSEQIKRLGREQFGYIWAKLKAVRAGEDYAYVCNMPENAYEAIYWTWRAIKHHETKNGRWQYGDSAPTVRELGQIYELATNPVDNLKMRFAEVRDEETCEGWFLLVYSCYLRFNRPWYRHPRWHVHHWRLQVHPWQTFRRWAFSRCAGCGGRFTWGYSPTGFQWDRTPPKLFCSEVDVYHHECANRRSVAVMPRRDNVVPMEGAKS